MCVCVCARSSGATLETLVSIYSSLVNGALVGRNEEIQSIGSFGWKGRGGGGGSTVAGSFSQIRGKMSADEPD